MTETLANRRVFRSKVDSIRPTYGFEDVSLAPGTDTVEPLDVVLAQDFCGIRLEIPVLAAAMDAVADVRLSGELGRLGGLSILNLEGVQFRYEDPAEVPADPSAALSSARSAFALSFAIVTHLIARNRPPSQDAPQYGPVRLPGRLWRSDGGPTDCERTWR